MISPPIVGVPAFAWCSSRPLLADLLAELALAAGSSMNFGPRKIVISIAAIPAIRIAPSIDRRRCSGRSVCASAITPPASPSRGAQRRR